MADLAENTVVQGQETPERSPRTCSRKKSPVSSPSKIVSDSRSVRSEQKIKKHKAYSRGRKSKRNKFLRLLPVSSSEFVSLEVSSSLSSDSESDASAMSSSSVASPTI